MSSPSSLLRAAFVALSMAAAGASSVAYAQDGQAMSLAVDSAPLVAVTSAGEKQFQVEIADDATERGRGLMFRPDMPDDRGMLFVFETSRPVGFWMRNTPMPLDLVFITTNGTVAGVQPGEPFSEAVISVPQPVQFVLELKRGTAAAVGLKTGDTIRHPVIAAAAKNG